MQIKKKSDIDWVLENFTSFACRDAEGGKHYLVFEDRKRGGQWTLMKYGAGHLFSIHGLGEDYKDEEETFFEERDSVAAFLWENRSVFNAAVKKLAPAYG
jgi:hypothetical protein